MEDRGRIIVELNDGVVCFRIFLKMFYIFENLYLGCFLNFRRSRKNIISLILLGNPNKTKVSNHSHKLSNFKFKSQYPQLLTFFAICPILHLSLQSLYP